MSFYPEIFYIMLDILVLILYFCQSLNENDSPWNIIQPDDYDRSNQGQTG
jgi:hypothetical protein